jgi:hypothetical protein
MMINSETMDKMGGDGDGDGDGGGGKWLDALTEDTIIHLSHLRQAQHSSPTVSCNHVQQATC